MRPKAYRRAIFGILLAALLGACSPASEPEVADASKVETRVAATVAARGAEDPTEPPTATEPPPSDTPGPPTAASTAPPTEETASLCQVVANGLNLRYGPGTVYAPPIGVLGNGRQMLPLARNLDGTWIEVEVLGTDQTGWVSAAAQFVSCEVDIASLPLGVIPPTPTPSPTPPVLVVGAIEGTVDQVVEDRVRLEISAHDPAVGDQNGDGIEFVRFAILFGDDIVYESLDSSPPYCAIPGDPQCFYEFPDPPEWPNGEAIQEGDQIVRATIHALDGQIQTVEAAFEVDLP